jgi:predicted nucleic acid-binding protein
VAVATYLADKSAIARSHLLAVHERLGPLIAKGLVASCTLIDLEVLFSTRTKREYDEVRRRRAGLEQLDMEQVDWDRAGQVQAELARTGRTRAVGIPDLLLAATAERHRVSLLHYDHDFDVIAGVTGQPTEWVVPAGSVP